MRIKVLLAIGLLFSAAAATADPLGCHSSEPRRVVAAVGGANRIVIVGRAGSLKVTGHPGGGDVVATGTACSSDKDFLKEIVLTAQRTGGDLRIEAVVPGQAFLFGWMESRLDFEVSVPDSLPVMVEDGSGETTIENVGPVTVTDGSGELVVRGVKGSASIRDGSGTVRVANIAGDVKIVDGSGSVEIEGVGGQVVIDDGSGSIDIRNVQKNVTVAHDGSGGIDVADVRGDFTVQHKGSGAVDYERVSGRVSIPHRR